jgi:hypothetical protein
MTQEFKAEMTEEQILRKLLWTRHGCNFNDLYGDDGEMQCSKCRIDFKRLPAKTIETMFEAQALRAFGEYIERG